MHTIRLIRPLMVALLLFGSEATHAIEICRTFNFKGFDRQTGIAESVIGSARTTNRDEMKVYVTVVEGQLYVQTNYVIPGTEAPTKLALDSKSSLAVSIWNLITDDPLKVTAADADSAVRNQITFYVDRFKLSQSQFADLDFTGAKQVIENPGSTPAAPATAALMSTASSIAPPQPQATVQVSSHPASAAEPVPKTISEAAISVLWSSQVGRWLLVLSAAAATLVGLLAALPDAVKQRILSRLGLMANLSKSKASKPVTRKRL